MSQNTNEVNSSCSVNNKKVKTASCTKRYCVSRMKLLQSGDIELNPGPDQNGHDKTTLTLGSTILLNYRLRLLGLRPLDVGGEGDCFFRAVSHQLFGDPNHHLHIRLAGIQYLRNHPERFIESNTENSWNDYLINMSMQGTWCDAIIVQAVAESQNVQIYIVESNENFAGVTLIEPDDSSQQPPTTIYIGHVDEIHYVSTVSNGSGFENQHNDQYPKLKEQGVFSDHHCMTRKRKHTAHERTFKIIQPTLKK